MLVGLVVVIAEVAMVEIQVSGWFGGSNVVGVGKVMFVGVLVTARLVVFYQLRMMFLRVVVLVDVWWWC